MNSTSVGPPCSRATVRPGGRAAKRRSVAKAAAGPAPGGTQKPSSGLGHGWALSVAPEGLAPAVVVFSFAGNRQSGESGAARPKRYDVLAGTELAPARLRLLFARESGHGLMSSQASTVVDDASPEIGEEEGADASGCRALLSCRRVMDAVHERGQVSCLRERPLSAQIASELTWVVCLTIGTWRTIGSWILRGGKRWQSNKGHHELASVAY